MSEISFTKPGFSLRGNGEMRAPSNSRIAITRRDELYELKIALKDKTIIIFFREDDVLVTGEEAKP